MEAKMLKNKLGENVWQNAFGVKTYLPTKEELEDIGFEVEEDGEPKIFNYENEYSSDTGQLVFKIINHGTDWRVKMCVKSGMWMQNEMQWVIHPQSSEEVKSIISSFIGHFPNRNNGVG